MKYAYLLQSLSTPNQRYNGIAEDLDARIQTHNAGRPPHTSKYCPWKIVLHLYFKDNRQAVEFERYLKPGSGHAFAKKRLRDVASR